MYINKMDKYIIRDTSTTLIIGFLIFLAFWIGKRGGSGGVAPTGDFTVTMVAPDYNVAHIVYNGTFSSGQPSLFPLIATNNDQIGWKFKNAFDNAQKSADLDIFNFVGRNDPTNQNHKNQDFTLVVILREDDTGLTTPISVNPLIYLCFLDDVKLLTPMGYKSAPELLVNDLVIDDNGQFRKITEIYCREVFKEEENEDWKLYTNGMSTFSHWHSIKEEKEYHNLDLQEFVFVHKHRQFLPIKKEFPYTLYNVKVEEGAHLITQCGQIIESMNGIH
jgi:hypothetical protein